MRHDFEAMQAAGLFGSARALASVTERFGMPGSGDAARVLEARVAGGFDFEVLPARGFDIGPAHLDGAPVSWFSPLSDGRSLDVPRGDDWLDRFTGGLLSTCGLDGIGAATAHSGLHGRIGHAPAREISHGATTGPDGLRGVTLRATIEQISLFGPCFRVERTIESTVDRRGTAEVRVRDVVENVGLEPAPVHLLYHVNLGAPLVVPGTTVQVAGSRARPRDSAAAASDPSTLPQPSAVIEEFVHEHVRPATDAAGIARATVTSPGGLSLTVSWTASSLPRLYQWVFPTRGRWALGIEPATAPLFGPERDRPHAGAPLLEPGERRPHELRITVDGSTR